MIRQLGLTLKIALLFPKGCFSPLAISFPKNGWQIVWAQWIIAFLPTNKKLRADPMVIFCLKMFSPQRLNPALSAFRILRKGDKTNTTGFEPPFQNGAQQLFPIFRKQKLNPVSKVTFIFSFLQQFDPPFLFCVFATRSIFLLVSHRRISSTPQSMTQLGMLLQEKTTLLSLSLIWLITSGIVHPRASCWNCTFPGKLCWLVTLRIASSRRIPWAFIC